MLLTSTQL